MGERESLEASYTTLAALDLLPPSSPPVDELVADPLLTGQDEWQLPMALWLHGGWAVQVHYRRGQVPEYAGDLTRIAALDGNPYGIRDITVLPPEPHLLGQEHGLGRGPLCALMYRSDSGGEHHELLSALLGRGEHHDLGRALPGEPLADGRRFLTIGPSFRPRSSEQSCIVVLAEEEAVTEYLRWAGKRWAARGTPPTAWRILWTGAEAAVGSSTSTARDLRERGAHPVLAQAVAAPERWAWDRNAQLEGLVAADRANTEHGLLTTWAAARAYGPDTSDEARELRDRGATAAVLLAEVFGVEEPLREAVTWPRDSERWGRLHPASALAPENTLEGRCAVRRRVLGPRVLETLRAALEDSADATGEEHRITPFVTVQWATDLALDDRVGGRSTVYQPLVQRHATGGNHGFVEKVLAAARAGTPDVEWLATPSAVPEEPGPVEPPTGAEALWRALVASGLLPEAVDAQRVDIVRSIPYLDEEDPEVFAVQVLEQLGIGRAVGKEGEIEPPYQELLLAFDEVSGGRVRIADVSQEVVDAERLALRWTQDGVRQEREVSAYRQFLEVDDARELLPRVVDPETGDELQLWEIEEGLVVLWAPPGAAERYGELLRGEGPPPGGHERERWEPPGPTGLVRARTDG
jgi:hypothetical protein